jgi:predicted lipoprotein with Yx(FWY)xxD motif
MRRIMAGAFVAPLVSTVLLVGLAVVASYAASMYTVDTAVAAVGGAQTKILVDGKGMALYYNTSDTAMQSSCTGGCAKLWPPLLSTTAPTSAQLPGKLAVVKTGNGSQVSYNGHLLYTYSGDTMPGQTNGQGVAGKWWVASVDVKAGSPASSATSTGTNTGNTGRYGW